jgi:hypothetical protein
MHTPFSVALAGLLALTMLSSGVAQSPANSELNERLLADSEQQKSAVIASEDEVSALQRALLADGLQKVRLSRDKYDATQEKLKNIDIPQSSK